MSKLDVSDFIVSKLDVSKAVVFAPEIVADFVLAIPSFVSDCG
jgi:hypothetical protein